MLKHSNNFYDITHTSLGSSTMTLLAPNFDVNLAASAHPPAPPPTISSLHLHRKMFN